MKRYMALVLSFICIIMVIGCNNVPAIGNQLENISKIELMSGSSGSSIEIIEKEKINTDVIPMVMVKGELYYDTGKESEITGRCGVPDGEITSSVDVSEIPTEDNQSNFGTGYEYQFWPVDQIEIFINNKWFVFEKLSDDGSI